MPDCVHLCLVTIVDLGLVLPFVRASLSCVPVCFPLIFILGFQPLCVFLAVQPLPVAGLVLVCPSVVLLDSLIRFGPYLK